ncbi:MAG: flagellar motor protein MotB [Acetobacterium sp.]
MARRQKKKKQIDQNAWLNTYADMITLVLVFFVLLYSMSTIDAKKYEMLVQVFNPQAIEKPAGEASVATQDADAATSPQEDITVEEVVDLEDLYQYLSQYAKANGLESSVQVIKGQDMVFVKFMADVFFEPDSARIKPGGKAILADMGKALSMVEPNVKSIRVDGHTAVAISPVNDRDLSTDRANEVVKYFENGYIVDHSKLLAVGFGMYRPIAPNDTEENRAKNRRVEILISKDDDIQNELDKIYNAEQSQTPVQ